jgi:L-fuculose-phosphate aldolase
VVAVDLDGDHDNVAAGMHLETVLHTEVYKRRPDVRSVVHGHPPYATAFGATDAQFAYLTHDSVLFIDGISAYDGVPDLIMDARQGALVADALGDGSALLLRNHGVLVAERDLRWAVLASVLLERAVRLQTIAASLGPLHPIPQDLLAAIHSVKYQAGFAAEYWDAWMRELRRSGRAFDMPGER